MEDSLQPLLMSARGPLARLRTHRRSPLVRIGICNECLGNGHPTLRRFILAMRSVFASPLRTPSPAPEGGTTKQRAPTKRKERFAVFWTAVARHRFGLGQGEIQSGVESPQSKTAGVLLLDR